MAVTNRKIERQLPTMLMGMFLFPGLYRVFQKCIYHIQPSPYYFTLVLEIFCICDSDAVHSGQGYNTT